MDSPSHAHFPGIDWLRGIAAFFIVGCHIGLLDRTPSGTALTYFCDMNVGVFAAISGFLFCISLIDKTDGDVRNVLIKRIRRLAPTYVVWSLFYLLVRCCVSWLSGGGGISEECGRGIRFWTWVIFGGGASCALWFLVNLLYAQAVLCLLWRIAPRLLSKAWFSSLLAVLMLAFSVVNHSYFGYYTARLFAFALLGWSLALCHGLLTHRVNVWALVVVVCLIAHCLLKGAVPQFARDFICVIPIIALAVSTSGTCPSAHGRFLASTSMGVYLWHALFAVGLQRIVMRFINAPYGAWVVLGVWTAVYLLALSTTILVGKTRFRRFQL